MATLLALLSSLLWGTSDFLGGTTSRRVPALDVVTATMGFGLLLLLPYAVISGAFSAPTTYLPWGITGGLVGLAALGAFYRGLADGTMGVVAPIAASGVVVPFAYGVIRGERPQSWQLGGVALAIAGVIAASMAPQGEDVAGEYHRARRASRRPIALAFGAAVGFGVVMTVIARGAASSIAMTLVTMRATSLVVLLVAALVLRRRPAVGRADLRVLAAAGTGDMLANATYAAASRHALVSIVAVLSSLYPAVTVLLARQLHDERLSRVQAGGVVAALLGVVLIGAG